MSHETKAHEAKAAAEPKKAESEPKKSPYECAIDEIACGTQKLCDAGVGGQAAFDAAVQVWSLVNGKSQAK